MMRRGLLSLLSAVAALLAVLGSHKNYQAAAWGNTGHSLTGRLAMQLLSDTTKQQLKLLLPNVDGDISLISSWADRVKRLPRYAHTGPLHYSDAHDDPPYACSYIFKRDCPDGNCVIAGIRNFTYILQEHRKNLLENSPDAFHTLHDGDDSHSPDADDNVGKRGGLTEYDNAMDDQDLDTAAFPITDDLHPNPAYLRHQVQQRDLRLFSDMFHSVGTRSRFAVVAKRRRNGHNDERVRQQRRRRRRNRRRNRNRQRRNRNPGGGPPRGPQKPTPPPGPPLGFVYTPQEAIKFLVHLVQDVHQPLHVSGREKGGNGADALFDGEHVNLHIVWDSKLLEKALNDDYGGSEMYLADVLLSKMRVEWEPEVETWMTCPAPERPGSPTVNDVESLDLSTTPPGFLTPLDMIMCPEHWAQGVDLLNCNNVWLKYSPDKDLSKEYYKENIALVLKSVAMGGVRLAALLEAIFNPDRL